MDATAINEIARLATEAAKTRDLDTFVPSILVGEKVVSLEGMEAGRSRFRGNFTTSSIRDFAEYVRANACSDLAQGFVDTGKLSARVFLNIGNPADAGHADWTANVVPKPTAAYAAVRSLDGQRLTQKDAIEWMEDWNTFLSGRYGTDSKPMAAVVAAIREIKVSTKGEQTNVENDNQRKRSAMEEVEASATGGIPSGVVMRVEPYEELSIRDFYLRISVITTGAAPVLAFRLAQKEAIEEEIAQEFKNVLVKMIGDIPSFTAGTFQP